MSNRWSEVRVGAFVLIALGIFVAGSLWIAGSGMFRPRGVSYTVLLTDSAGLQPGDRVRVAGVPVGRIRSLELRTGEAWPVKMEISVGSEIGLHTDSSAGIATEGLLGVPFLQIDSGTAEAPALEPGGTIAGVGSSGINDALAGVGELSEQAREMFLEATNLLKTVSKEVTPVLDGLERMLSEENAQNLAALLETTNKTVKEAGPRLSALMTRLDGLAGEAETTLADIPDLTEKLGGLVDDLRAAMGTDGERVATLLDTATRSFDSADRTLSSVAGSQHELEVMLSDLQVAVAHLKAFTQLLNERPYSLIRMKLPPDRKPGDRVGGKK